MRILVYFSPNGNDDLAEWVRKTGRHNKSYFGREAFECYRLFNGSLAQAQEAARALAEMRRLFGDNWEAGVKQFEEATGKV